MTATWSRYTRSSVLEVIGQDYIRTARAKGLRAAAVLQRHTLRNALIPLITLGGLEFRNLFGGALVTESGEEKPAMARAEAVDPEREAILADSVGLALLVVLDRLTPAERLAFVLHDMFAVPFEEIAEIAGRSPEATRQLASRARRRVQGAPVSGDANRAEQRKVVDAFLAALRAGDFEGLVAVLDPNVVFRADASSAAGGVAREIHGAETWAHQAMTYARGMQHVQAVLVNGEVGVILAPRGKLLRALTFVFEGGKIKEIEVVGEPERLQQMEFAVIGE